MGLKAHGILAWLKLDKHSAHTQTAKVLHNLKDLTKLEGASLSLLGVSAATKATSAGLKEAGGRPNRLQILAVKERHLHEVKVTKHNWCVQEWQLVSIWSAKTCPCFPFSTSPPPTTENQPRQIRLQAAHTGFTLAPPPYSS